MTVVVYQCLIQDGLGFTRSRERSINRCQYEIPNHVNGV